MMSDADEDEKYASSSDEETSDDEDATHGYCRNCTASLYSNICPVGLEPYFHEDYQLLLRQGVQWTSFCPVFKGVLERCNVVILDPATFCACLGLRNGVLFVSLSSPCRQTVLSEALDAR